MCCSCWFHCDLIVYGNSWCVMMCRDVSSWFIMVCDVSWYVMMFCHGSWCLLMCHDVSSWFVMCHDVLSWFMMSHDVLWCFVMVRDVLWCFVMVRDVLWCVKMFHHGSIHTWQFENRCCLSEIWVTTGVMSCDVLWWFNTIMPPSVNVIKTNAASSGKFLI